MTTENTELPDDAELSDDLKKMLKLSQDFLDSIANSNIGWLNCVTAFGVTVSTIIEGLRSEDGKVFSPSITIPLATSAFDAAVNGKPEVFELNKDWEKSHRREVSNDEEIPPST